MSERLGAAAAFDPRPGRLAEEIRARTEGRGADAVLVAVPLPSALAEGLALARPGGRVLLFAQNDPHMKIEFPAAAVGVEEKEILGSYSAACGSPRGVRRRWSSLESCLWSQLITHRFSAGGVRRGHRSCGAAEQLLESCDRSLM